MRRGWIGGILGLAWQLALAQAAMPPPAARADPASKTALSGTPAAFARALLEWQLPRAGLPAPDELAALRDRVDARLWRRLRAAAARDARCRRATPPDRKPDLWEHGWLIGGSDDTSMAWIERLQVAQRGPRARVDAVLVDGAVARGRWHGELRQRHGRWQLVDVIDGEGRSLRAALATHAAEPCAAQAAKPGSSVH